MGTVVQATKAGIITGARLVTCGPISSVTINIQDIWKDAKYPGKLIIEDHDASLYTDPNCMLTSNWTMEIPWKVKLNIDGKWKSIKRSGLKDMGLTELSFRRNIQPLSDQHAKLFIGAVPLSTEELRARGDAGSRFFPTVKLMECRAKLWPIEEPHHKLGVGLQPLILLDDCQVDNEGYFVLEGVVWPNSEDVKRKQAVLLQASTMPNYHLTADRWQESVTKGQFARRETPVKWPTPRPENEETEESTFEDTEGEFSYIC